MPWLVGLGMVVYSPTTENNPWHRQFSSNIKLEVPRSRPTSGPYSGRASGHESLTEAAYRGQEEVSGGAEPSV